MRKILLTLLLPLTCTTLLALTPSPVQEGASLPPPKTEIQYPNNTTQPVNCFDYYKFGSVYASLETKNYTNISGTKMNFFWEIKNENSYPIVNGKLFVKIMRQNDTYDKTGGQDEVDSYVVKENISLKANSSIPVSFDWDIPSYALSGDYQASTYFIVDNSFNMSGLSFTTDIVGWVAKFAVQWEQKTSVFFDRTKIKLNNNPYYTVAFTPSVTETESANITLTLTNTTNETQRVPVTLDLYFWDAQNQKNLLKQDTQTFLLNPNSSIEIPYIVTDTAHSVYFLQAKAQYQDTKSEVSVRFGRQNIQEPRINFTTLTTYPLEKGKENNLLTCAHNTNNNDADYGKVITTIYNYKGKQIHQSQYEGKITGAIQGMNYTFTPQANYKDFTIETKIYNKAWAITNESKLTYTCSEFSDNCTEPQFMFDPKVLLSILTILLLIILIFIKKHLKNKNIITSLLIVLSLWVMMMPGEVEGKSVKWTKFVSGQWHMGDNELEGGQPYLTNPYFQVEFYGNVKNLTTGQILTENAVVNSGDTLRFIFGKSDTDFSEDYKDIFWFTTGYTTGSPYGEWSINADMISMSEWVDWAPFQEWIDTHDTNFITGDYLRDSYSVCMQQTGIVNLKQVCDYWYNFISSNPQSFMSSLTQYNVNPPNKSLNNQSGLTCGNFDQTKHYIDCIIDQVTNNTIINPLFHYESTFGLFHISEPPFRTDIPSQSIPFTLTIERCAAANTPPTAPSIILTPTTMAVGQNTSIAFTSTDTQNDTITYQIDWGDGVITTETSPTLKSWTTAGTKTLKVRALDTCGESAWTTNTIVVNALPVLDPLTVTADPTCGSVVLNWNNNTATSYQVFRKEGTGSYSAVSPSLTTTTFTDTTITDGHTYTYQIWSGKSTISRLSNAMIATPTCPPPADLCNNIEDIQTTVPTGLASTAGNCTCGG